MAVYLADASSNTGYLTRPAEISGAPYTRVAWFKFDDDDKGSTMWSLENEAATQYDNPEVREPNFVRLLTNSGSTDSATSVWSDDTWHQFALTRSGNDRALYRLDNGVALLISRNTADALTIEVETLLGYDGEGNAAGRAVADDKCWAAALTPEELALESQQRAPVRTANLVSYTKFTAHTDLSDEIAGSWTAINQTPTTVAGPANVAEVWEGPRVASSATTAGTTSSGGLSCNMPSGIEAGDLLLAQAANDSSVSWSANWTSIDDGANGSAVQGATWARIATGSDALTITGEAQDIAVVVSRIVNHGVTNVATDIIKGTAATGSSNAPNGPNCNPGTSGKYLWITHYAADDDDNTALWWPAEGAPVAQIKSATGTSSCMTGVAYRWLEASSYDPSAFALSASEEWRAQTFAIPPAGGAGPVTGSFAVTESGVDTAAFAGDVLIDGSLAATESGGDTAALAGDVLISGTFAATESGADVAAIQGTAQQVSTGSLAATESGADTASIAGTVLVEGALAATESGSDTAAIAGDVPVSGTLAATESGADTAALAGDVYISGALAATESGSDTAAIEGSLAVIATGSLAATESGSDTASIAGVVLVSGSLAATEAANDSAAFAGLVLVTGALAATESGQDTAAFASATPVVAVVAPKPAGRPRYRRVILGERLYNVLERDVPALLEAELFNRAPPTTAEVIEGPKPRRKRARKAPQPVKTVAEVRQAVQEIKARIEPDNAWLMQALETVAFRVLERLQDEEDSLMLLLAA
jgi:hypothetical protein